MIQDPTRSLSAPPTRSFPTASSGQSKKVAAGRLQQIQLYLLQQICRKPEWECLWVSNNKWRPLEGQRQIWQQAQRVQGQPQECQASAALKTMPNELQHMQLLPQLCSQVPLQNKCTNTRWLQIIFYPHQQISNRDCRKPECHRWLRMSDNKRAPLEGQRQIWQQVQQVRAQPHECQASAALKTLPNKLPHMHLLPQL